MKNAPKFEGGQDKDDGYDPDLTIEGMIKGAGVTPKYEWPNAHYVCPECGGWHDPETSHMYRK